MTAIFSDPCHQVVFERQGFVRGELLEGEPERGPGRARQLGELHWPLPAPRR